MKKLLPVLLGILSLGSSCRDKDKTTVTTSTNNTNGLDSPIVLNDLEASANAVTLTWTVNANATAINYFSVYRKIHPDSAEQQIAQATVNTFTDTMVPVSPYLGYRVSGFNNAGQVIYSNTKEYSRPDLKVFDIDIYDALYDSEANKLYLFGRNGAIALYDMQSGSIIKQVNTAATIGYTDMVIHNGQREIYVPRNDGWVFVYNAALDKIDQVNVGDALSSVAYSNGYLYAATGSSTSSSNFSIKVFNRDTKQQVNNSMGYYGSNNMRIMKVPNSSTDLIALQAGYYSSSYDKYYFKFNPDGTYIMHTYGSYNSYTSDGNLFEISPDGNKFITSSSGIVYNKDLSYSSSLPRGNLYFTGFGYGQNNNLIYAGCNDKSIQVYSAGDYNLQRTLSTSGYPFKIFYDDGSIICVSKTIAQQQYYYNPVSSKVLIEKYQ